VKSMSMQWLTDAIYQSSVSQAIQNHDWVIPTVQSVHILAVATLMGSAIVLNLKAAGFLARTEPSIVVFRRYMPWLWWALAVLLASGLMMVVGEPERVLSNWVFWTKMTLVLIACFLTLIMRAPMLRHDLAEKRSVWRLIVKPLGILSLSIWVLVIFCGRWIAYMQ